MIKIGCYVSMLEPRVNKYDHEICLEDKKSYHFKFLEEKKIFNSCPSLITIDLLYVSLFVCGADKLISREDSKDCWKRDIFLEIPVLNYEIWNRNVTNIINMLNFLSGDNWNIIFRSRNLSEKEKKSIARINRVKPKKHAEYVDTVSMFSGGLDSFIGLIDCLEKDINRTIFVSHYGKGKGTREYQTKLIDAVLGRYLIDESMFYSFHASILGGKENTTRTRSFMFFSYAIAIASTYKHIKTLSIPENGFISLNIPLTDSRIGSSSTRTTHPQYMKYFQRLLNDLNIHIKIENPYQFMTKGEMIEKCENKDFLQKNLINTMSCSHPDIGRYKMHATTGHCGYCLPCIIRKAAILKGKLEDTSLYHNFEGETADMNYNSYIRGIKAFDKSKKMFIIQKNGQICDNFQKYADIYERGIIELEELLSHEGKL